MQEVLDCCKQCADNVDELEEGAAEGAVDGTDRMSLDG